MLQLTSHVANMQQKHITLNTASPLLNTVVATSYCGDAFSSVSLWHCKQLYPCGRYEELHFPRSWCERPPSGHRSSLRFKKAQVQQRQSGSWSTPRNSTFIHLPAHNLPASWFIHAEKNCDFETSGRRTSQLSERKKTLSSRNTQKAVQKHLGLWTELMISTN